MHSFLPRLYSSVSNLHFSLVWSLVYILCSHQLFAHSLGSDQQRTEHFLYKNYRYSSHPLCFAATLLLLLLLTTIFYSLDKITQKILVLLKHFSAIFKLYMMVLYYSITYLCIIRIPMVIGEGRRRRRKRKISKRVRKKKRKKMLLQNTSS